MGLFCGLSTQFPRFSLPPRDTAINVRLIISKEEIGKITLRYVTVVCFYVALHLKGLFVQEFYNS